jgi:hypothetical protein
MPFEIAVLDETTAGVPVTQAAFPVDSADITLRDLIRRRVRREVERFNESDAEVFQGLVQPEESERLLNGFRLHPHRELDWREQLGQAVSSFERNGVLVILDDRQLTSLDEPVRLTPSSQLHFLKLVPLVGG